MDGTQVTKLCRGAFTCHFASPVFALFEIEFCVAQASLACYVTEAGLAFLTLLVLALGELDYRYVLPPHLYA